ncbi:MAG: phenylacetic acid degradation bifunctional protein PaaZ [Actinomycetota bacterium]
MAEKLPSYVAGGWKAGAGEGETVHDAVTGEEVARMSTEGIDFARVLDHARTAGGPPLRAMTFHQRAGLLKALAQYLDGRKEELYTLSPRTGATRADSWIDIDGGIGTLFVYASRGKRELPDDTIYVDGGVEALGKRGTFVAQHLYTPLAGAQVQINAFNFPVWGFLEKLGPAFLAGVPTIVKPASQTAYLTEAVVRQIVESGLLPGGALQLIAGGVGDLLDHLTGQDLVAFTGSARTAAKLRAHPAVVEHSVRFNAEADSLNASILGPDAGPDTPEFGLYVDQLVTEMTVKAGQKCTAIRRAFVPVRWLDPMADAIRAKLETVVVGNPSSEGVTMGSLVSLAQREEVRGAIERLAGGATLVAGDPGKVDAVDADTDRGAFLAPILLRAEDGSRDEPHQVEAFGPVSTLIGYGGTAEEAVTLAARGAGSLVGSVVTADREFAREVVLGVAPWHGRLLVLDRDDAKESTGHGSALPHLVHGGPGRAGGGEELGGIRGVLHHMQRTAVQASPNVLARVTGRWVEGADRDESGTHPFRRHLEELNVGDGITVGPRTVTLEDIEAFADLTGDRFYAHMDQEAAAANPFFDGRVAHGYFIVSAAAGLFVDPDPGPVLANYGLENLRFVKPVYPGDAITVRLTAKAISPRGTDPHGEVTWDTVVTNQDGEVVAAYDVLTLVAKRPV